ncbi:MAG: outer membrane lipoprotein carrier protein LolA [Deltaproteobacteria bacterium]|nr:outer membrane lipoprotein carrier protein LolA [Candidatus Anaeroferrophillacea bacterium]
MIPRRYHRMLTAGLVLLVLLAVYCIMSHAATAAETAAAGHRDLLQKIEQVFRAHERWAGTFSQRAETMDGGPPMTARGTLAVSLPDKMRWEYEEPERQYLISDGTTLWFYDPGLNQVMVGEVAGLAETRLLVGLLRDLSRVAEDFSVTVTPAAASDKHHRVELVPVPTAAGGRPFERLTLEFDAGSLRLVESELFDAFGSRIVITYAWAATKPPSFPTGHFTFTPPSGTDVVPLGQ